MAAPFGARVPLKMACSTGGLAPDPPDLFTSVETGIATVDSFAKQPLRGE